MYMQSACFIISSAEKPTKNPTLLYFQGNCSEMYKYVNVWTKCKGALCILEINGFLS